MIWSILIYFLFLIIVILIGLLSRRFPNIYWLDRLALRLKIKAKRLKKFLKVIFKKIRHLK